MSILSILCSVLCFISITSAMVLCRLSKKTDTKKKKIILLLISIACIFAAMLFLRLFVFTLSH